MRKLINFVPQKPVSKPFGEGSGEAHTFFVGKDGVLAISETDNGCVEIVKEKSPGGPRQGLLFLANGGYARLDDSEVKQPPPAAAKKEKPE